MNQKAKLVVIMMLSTLALSACKTIDTPHGELPAEAMQYVGKVVGTYQNTADQSTVDIRMNGNRLIASYSSKTNQDILNSSCGSRIEDLTKIIVNSNNNVTGVFAFNRNLCVTTLQGETIELQANESGNAKVLTVNYQMENKMEQECTLEFPAGQPPKQVCQWKNKPVYFKKTFTRK